MKVNRRLVEEFESALDPRDPENCSIPAKVLGYGEISIILQIGDDDKIAYKRLPLFRDRKGAETYEKQFHEYCSLLTQAGIRLPQHQTIIVELPGKPVVLYIAQEQFPVDLFAHKLIHHLDQQKILAMVDHIVKEIDKVWKFNSASAPKVQLAIDAQISNWVLPEDPGGETRAIYIDTSTPLYRIDGEEQMDPELFLQSAPAFLRWLIRWLFLADVMNRYYDPRLVYIDLAANLFKEQRPDLIPDVINIVNQNLPSGFQPVQQREVEKYYKEDKLIWTLFLAFRRIDRWITTKILRKRYEFLLPGKIQR